MARRQLGSRPVRYVMTVDVIGGVAVDDMLGETVHVTVEISSAVAWKTSHPSAHDG